MNYLALPAGLVLPLLLGIAQSDESRTFDELDGALKQARKTGKPVFVYLFDSI